jgi:hypothetical protein
MIFSISISTVIDWPASRTRKDMILPVSSSTAKSSTYPMALPVRAITRSPHKSESVFPMGKASLTKDCANESADSIECWEEVICND